MGCQIFHFLENYWALGEKISIISFLSLCTSSQKHAHSQWLFHVFLLYMTRPFGMEGIILSNLFLVDTVKHHIISIETSKIHKSKKNIEVKKKPKHLFSSKKAETFYSSIVGGGTIIVVPLFQLAKSPPCQPLFQHLIHLKTQIV